MKGSRLYKVLSVMLSFMLVLSLFPTQALADGEDIGGLSVVAPTSYEVVFKDGDTVLSTQSVLEGQPATEPAHPAHDGYVANGWDADFSAVTSNMTINALYKPVQLHIYIYIGNGTSNLLQHYVMSPLTSGQITTYSGLTNKALVNKLQTDTGFGLAGKSSFIQNNDMTGNGTVQLESTSDPAVYNVNIHLKDNIDVDYTVRYVDDNGTEIHDDYTNDGKVGQTITKSAISISGYTLISESPKSIKLNFGSNVITFVYSRTYTITYNNMSGATNNPANPSTYTKVTPTFTLQNPTKLGYTFNGWTPTDITIEQGSTGNLTFTASWTLTNYNITYELNGGINSPSNPSTYTYNSATITLQNPTRAGYNFLNWSPTNKILNHSTGDKTFTASWSAPLVYTISYVMNGGVNNPANPTSYTVLDTPITLGTPTRTGYTFNGWSDGGVIPSGGTGNKTFTASWVPTAFNITYNLGGGTNNGANPATYNITSPTINLQNPTRAGYTFTGWSPSSSIPTGSTGDKAFTAGWQPIAYDITYELNGGVNASGNPSKYTVETPTFTLADPTKDGYNFVRWEPADATIEQGTTGDLNFEAIWSDAVEYNITYNLDGGLNGAGNPSTYTIESGLITLADPTKDGYTFTGWTPTDNIPAGSTGDKEFTATWSDPIVYDITYNLDGGVNDLSNPATYTVASGLITLAAPTKDGYTFTGWTPTDNIPAGSTGNKEFTATWSEAIVYDITYNLDGGVNDLSNPATYTVESGLITLANPTKAGYTFTGWTPTDNIPAGSTGDKEFTASWSEAIVYDITYNLDGGTNDASNPATYTVESGLITLANPTKAGYNFLGWTPTDNIPAGSTGDKEFTATWSSAIVYNITYDLAGGVNNGANPATYTVNSATINLAAPTKAGYNFTGWTPASSIPTGSTGDKSFTATWSAPIDYTITYVLGGGTNDPSNPATYNVASSTITLAAPTRLGYNFLGWNPTGVISAGSTGNKTFTARWSSAIRYNITYTMNGGNNNLLNPSSYTVNSGTITLRDPWRIGYTFAGWTPTNTIPTGSTGDKAFTATWTAKVYNITYFMQGGTNNPANPATFTVETLPISFATPTKAGYEFWFWLPGGVPAGTAMDWATLAVWKAATNYSITYNLNGGTNNPANPSTYNVESSTINLADPTREGYTFNGWSPAGTIPAGSTGNKEFTASWTAVDYTITYNLGGGTNAAGNPATYTIETPTFTLGDPTRDYYTFAGWTPSDTTIEQGSTGDLTFTASWTPITYNISYVLGGGTNDAANPATYNTETATFTLADPTRPGYNFLGWDPADATIEVGSHGDLTFTAIWSDPIVYTVTYALGGGINAPTNPATYTVESPLITLAAPARLGYNFVSWAPGATIPAGSTGDKLFTATWSAPIVYPITYVMNGGANAAANPATYTIESPTITLAAPVQAGYVFLGWTPAGVIPTGSTGALTFTANWSAPIVYPITYTLNGGTNAPGNPGTYTVVSGLITLADATRTGYDFLGWTPTDNIPTGSTGARAFTATWSQPHVHTVTYFVNGGTDTGLDGATPYRVYNNVAYGSVVPVPGNPSQDNYTFDGWTTAIPVNMPDADVVIYGSLTQLPAPQEIIANERTPLAGPTWSLLNLILTALTALGIGSIISIFQKKRENKGSARNKAFSFSTLLPTAGAIVVFVLTQVLSGSMVFADRWSYLFAGITLVQAAVVAMAMTGKPKKV
ncbi:MAG TPA: InlB B-repeat-containing protein [Clostridia bacterium]|nr:InlB B-repeat-containing protein [Clostridia bacterium]